MIGQRSVRPVNGSRLPQVGRAYLALRRGSASDLGEQTMKLAATALEAELKTPALLVGHVLAPPVSPARIAGGGCILQLSLAALGKPALLLVEEGLAAALSQSLGTGEPPSPHAPGPLSRAEAAATSFLALCVLRALRETGPLERILAPRLVRLVRALDELDAPLRERPWLGVDLALRIGTVHGELVLLLPSEAAPLLAREGAAPAPGALPQVLRSAALTASLLAGRAELEEGDLSTLAPKDVLLLTGVSRRPEGVAGPAQLSFQGFSLRGRLEGRQLEVESIETAAKEPIVETVDLSPLPPPLPIQVEVELARLRIPLGELERLKPGEVLTLERGLGEPVVLRIGARAFATAELVDVEGELGARILTLVGEG